MYIIKQFSNLLTIILNGKRFIDVNKGHPVIANPSMETIST